jgi:hypothetical protein
VIRARTLLSALTLAGGLLGTPSRAGAEEAASAEVLFKRGSELLKAGDIELACHQLELSYALDHGTGTLGMLAFCHESQERFGSAWTEYLRVAAQARAAGQRGRAEVAEERARRLRPRLSRLTIHTPVPLPDLVVYQDGLPLLPEELGVPRPVDGGSIEVAATAPGYEGYRVEVGVASQGDDQVIEIPPLSRLRPVQHAPPLPRVPAERPREPSAPLGPLVAAGAVTAGGLLAGTYFGLLALEHDRNSARDCRGNSCGFLGLVERKQALESARVSTVGFAIAGVGLLGGALVLSVPMFRGELKANVSSSPEEVAVTVGGSIQ